ncbi:hypothetical protein EN817_25985 [Mesorhizobium sp. M3A.F.Ca.ET.174.01.1.1]|uniref:hypothetical protein n=1 Tax=unclassified Mesorhizobium TaxID=325217 RepID=UPI001093B0EF|nr:MULTISPECIES: hypothetical protein [unclassified Mesorhizobium]TGS65776.1 hypothetical protein EN844_16360 [Mesorhizobium sp. M3A.F.Ca.ET.201.01.1.1]TGS82626.1 hypothetical protein EN818_26035 [Mesorhizobium sp. M3A.F.Ca.ET.175.01.1.1]TGT22569.1 hypothetical protein EN817_25985 [Mesorhizobium sp. M3A.F.Ca.ET.174.01.1.1]
MMTKSVVIAALTVGIGCGVSAPSSAGSRDHRLQSERYVPAEGDLIDILFGGPRYYDQQLFTTGGEPCSYQRTGPDANAINKINDHHCGK